MKNKTISILLVLATHTTLFAQNMDKKQNIEDNDFIKSIKINLKKLEKNIHSIDDNASQYKTIKLNNDGLTNKILYAISEIERKAITKAEAKKIKIIAEAEANKANIIAKALKDRMLAEAEAVKATTIAKAKAIAEIERKRAKMKEKENISYAVDKFNKARETAELTYKNETKKIQDKLNEALGLKEENNNTTKEAANAQEANITDKTKFVVDKTLGARENIFKLFNFEKISFKTGQHKLTENSILIVNKLAKILNFYPNISIEIAGHTDAEGSQKSNQKLSQARVDTIKKLLISKGINAKRLKAKGYGESKPLVPNTSKKNKEKNRRIEINII